MLITMFTDSSFNRKLNRATWAAWFKCDGKTLRYSGIVKQSVSQSGDGELAAIANGLKAIKLKLAPPAGSRIIAQTDSVEAIHAIRSGNHIRLYSNQATKYILEIVKTEAWRLDLRHVKGHKGTQTPRNAVNSWCDVECRRLMGQLIESSVKTQGELELETKTKGTTL